MRHIDGFLSHIGHILAVDGPQTSNVFIRGNFFLILRYPYFADGRRKELLPMRLMAPMTIMAVFITILFVLLLEETHKKDCVDVFVQFNCLPKSHSSFTSSRDEVFVNEGLLFFFFLSCAIFIWG